MKLLAPGGSVEYFNEESGEVWMGRITDTYDKIAWINPTPKDYWGHTHSVSLVRDLIDDKMYPLTIEGLEEAMRYLVK